MGEIEWTNAKTYADAPHEYILRRDQPELFDKYCALIRAEGVDRPFTLRGRTAVYRYYYGQDGHKYWIVGVVLNRAVLTRGEE